MIAVMAGAFLALQAHGQDQATLPAPDATPAAAPESMPDSAPPAPETDTTAAQPPGVTAGNYLLKNNDLIRITVFQEDDLTTESRISKTGYITFPLLGLLHLEGMTVSAAQEEIRALLDKDYIVHPHVTLSVIESPSWAKCSGPAMWKSPRREGLISWGRLRWEAVIPRMRIPPM